jgi:hypothetical protein
MYKFFAFGDCDFVSVVFVFYIDFCDAATAPAAGRRRSPRATPSGVEPEYRGRTYITCGRAHVRDATLLSDFSHLVYNVLLAGVVRKIFNESISREFKLDYAELVTHLLANVLLSVDSTPCSLFELCRSWHAAVPWRCECIIQYNRVLICSSINALDIAAVYNCNTYGVRSRSSSEFSLHFVVGSLRDSVYQALPWHQGVWGGRTIPVVTIL